MLKKSYTGFIVWMFLFIGILFSLSFLPVEDESIMIRAIFVFTSLAIAGMMLLIYFTEQVYWINGVTYEQAVEAGSARRKAFALRHLVRFGICTAIYLLFAVVGQIIGWPFWIDIIVFTVGVIATAISTIGITL